MRELQLWDAGEGLQNTFRDAEELAALCKFSDCQHETEPDCKIKKAIEEGTLSQIRFDGYVKLQRELLAVETKKKWKKLGHLADEIRRNKERWL